MDSEIINYIIKILIALAMIAFTKKIFDSFQKPKSTELNEEEQQAFRLLSGPLEQFIDYVSAQQINPNIADIRGVTLLIAAINIAHDNNEKAIVFVKFLLEYGSDVNLPDIKGRTPLLYAVYWNFQDIVVELLKFKPDLNKACGSMDVSVNNTQFQTNPLCASLFKLKNDDYTIPSLLIEAGASIADAEAISQDGHSQYEKKHEVFLELRQHLILRQNSRTAFVAAYTLLKSQKVQKIKPEFQILRKLQKNYLREIAQEYI